MFGQNAYGQQLQQFQKQVEQLRREVRMSRQKVSACGREIVAFCEEEKRKDPLIFKVPSSENPFVERNKVCSIL